MTKEEELQTRINKLVAERRALGRAAYDMRAYNSLTSLIWRLRKQLGAARRESEKKGETL